MATATGQTAGYLTTDTLVIPAGALFGSVAIEAIEVGTAYNQAEFALTTSAVGLAYVSSIYNDEKIDGGTDLEPLTATLDRAQFALRSRDVLVSVEDFEIAAQESLGAGSNATCIPLLGADKQVYKVGQVHIFLLDALGQPPSSGTCQAVQTELQKRSFAASTIWVSPASIYDLNIEVVANTDQVSLELANELYLAAQEYLKPANYKLGSTLKVKELEFIFRSVFNVAAIESVLINGAAVNAAMPTPYHQPVIETLAVTLVDGKDSSTFYLGTGTGDTD